MPAKNYTKIQPNDIFGNLTVLERIGTAKNGQPIWKCQCICGNIIEVYGNKLRSGLKTHCGCQLHKNAKNEIGNKYGKLLVIEKANKPSHVNNRHAYWKCQCDCGNIFITDSQSLRKGQSVSCGCRSFSPEKQSKGEKIITEFLQLHNINFQTEYTFTNLRTSSNHCVRFDFAIFDDKSHLQCLIEFQGAQHFLNNAFGKFQREITDPLKNNYCKDHNIKLYYINYNDNIENKLLNIYEELNL